MVCCWLGIFKACNRFWSDHETILIPAVCKNQPCCLNSFSGCVFFYLRQIAATLRAQLNSPPGLGLPGDRGLDLGLWLVGLDQLRGSLRTNRSGWLFDFLGLRNVKRLRTFHLFFWKELQIKFVELINTCWYHDFFMINFVSSWSFPRLQIAAQASWISQDPEWCTWQAPALFFWLYSRREHNL